MVVPAKRKTIFKNWDSWNKQTESHFSRLFLKYDSNMKTHFLMTLTYDIHDSISLMKTSFHADFLQLIWPKLQNRRCANFRSILQKKNTFWKWWWEWLFRKCSFPDLSQDWGLLKRARPQMAPTINGTRICATRPFFTAKLCDFFICTCIANPTLPPTRFSSQFCHKEEWTDHKITII